MGQQRVGSLSPDESTEQPAFGMGESGDTTPGGFETMGASYGIRAFRAAPPTDGAPTPPISYLMPNVKYRNGGSERVADAIGLTPLGGLMPGPNAIAPAIPAGQKGAMFAPDDASDSRAFDTGVMDSFPEGCPVPFSVR